MITVKLIDSCFNFQYITNDLLVDDRLQISESWKLDLPKSPVSSLPEYPTKRREGKVDHCKMAKSVINTCAHISTFYIISTTASLLERTVNLRTKINSFLQLNCKVNDKYKDVQIAIIPSKRGFFLNWQINSKRVVNTRIIQGTMHMESLLLPAFSNYFIKWSKKPTLSRTNDVNILRNRDQLFPVLQNELNSGVTKIEIRQSSAK